MIEVSKVTYQYGKEPVIKDATLKVTNGKIYGIFGLEGSGKSLLLSLMAGARDLQTGMVRINGFDLQREPVSAKRCIGYCPQTAQTYPDMTVYELLDFVAEVHALRDNRRYVQVHEWMQFFDLEKLRNRRISKLTPFQLLRLKLTRAVVGGAEILLLDEPGEGLSEANIVSMRKMILALKKKGKTVFLAPSRAADAVELSAALARLQNGALSEFAPVEEWMKGCSLMLRVMGERQTALDILSEIDGLESCQPLGKDEDGALKLRIRAISSDRAEAIESALSTNGLECSVEIEEADDTLAALREACDVPEAQEEATEGVKQEASEFKWRPNGANDASEPQKETDAREEEKA